MKLTIIETGLPPEPMRADWPRYPELFQNLLEPHISGLETETISVVTGEAFPDLEETQAILVTGSAAGVYENHPWMQPLFEFIRSAAGQKVPQIGICFGHQAIAKALGAKVQKSEKGWGIGRHTYEICQRPGWMNGYESETFSLGVSHQDQVQSLPPGASVIAASDFTPFAVLDYGDVPAISFQGHPEFSGG
ncbi:MAG: type 1 glutamine amidotransferase [Henriciella sp.]